MIRPSRSALVELGLRERKPDPSMLKTTLRFSLSYLGWSLHREYRSDESLVIFECGLCGHTRMTIGGIHGHISQHEDTPDDDYGELMDYTIILRVDETTEIDVEEVDGL